MLRGFERVEREHKNHLDEIEVKSIQRKDKKRKKTKDKGEGDERRRGRGIWSLIHATDKCLDVKACVEQYVRTYIKNSSENEITIFDVSAVAEGFPLSFLSVLRCESTYCPLGVGDVKQESNK